MQTPHKHNHLRLISLLFLLVFGAFIAMVGYIVSNSVLTSVILDLTLYTVALVSDAIFEGVRDGSLHFFTKMLQILKSVLQQFLNPLVPYTMLAITLTILLVNSFLVTPELHARACISTPLRIFCGNGIGISQITIDDSGQKVDNGNLITIGIIDEHTGEYQRDKGNYSPFDPFDTTNEQEKRLLAFILNANEEADKGEHFTLILATTLSRTIIDNGFSASVGQEELRGAYMAQKEYNADSNHKSKLRLLVANLGVKYAARTIAPLVAAQIALVAKNSPASDHFIGAVGFPFSLTAQMALPTLQENDIQVVASSPSTDLLSNEPNFLRIEPPDSQQITAITSFIRDVLNAQKVIVMYDERPPKNGGDPYSNSLGDATFNKLQESNKVDVTPLSYNVGQPTTIENQLEKILNFKPDLLFFAGYPDDLNVVKEMLKRAAKRGVGLPNLRIMGAQAFYELGGYRGNNYANLFFTTFAFPDARERPDSVQFQNTYKQTFDPDNTHIDEYGYQRAGPHSALTYDAVKTFTTSVERTTKGFGAPSVEDIQNSLPTIPVNGSTGTTTFHDQHSNQRSNPKDKLLYLVCTNKEGFTQEVGYYDKDGLHQIADIKTTCT